MSIKPIISLPVQHSTISAVSFLDSGPWAGFPNAWQVEFNITPQSHGDDTTPTAFQYNALDLAVGDWILTSTGQAVQITAINTANSTSILLDCTVEDIDLYNINSEPNFTGSGFPISDIGVAFKVDDEGKPVIDPAPTTNLTPFNLTNLIGRFQYTTSAKTELSQFINDVGFISEGSADTRYVNEGDLSALSQFVNDAGYVTEDTATSVISQLVNDQGYITETSAIILVNELETSILANGFVSAQQVEDAIDAKGYITEGSANTAFVAQGDLSSLSQFVNDLNYITEDTATSVISQLANDAGYVSAAQFVGGGIIDIVVSGTEIRISAESITNVQATNIGTGEQIAVQTSGSETTYRTVVANGGIELSASPTELVFSAAPNPVNLSQLVNDTGFISEGSADTRYVNEGDLSSLSQFNNDVGFITEASADFLYQPVGSLSALSQFVNDTGYVTEDTATSVISQLVNDQGYVTEASVLGLFSNLSALSQFNNDVGFITEASAQSLIAAIEVSALSQLINDQGFVSATQFVGGGAVTVFVSGQEIRISANSSIEVLSSGVSTGSFTSIDYRTDFSNTDGLQTIISAEGNTAVVTNHIPRVFRFRINAGASTGVNTSDPVSGLPTGWTLLSAGTTFVAVDKPFPQAHRLATCTGFSSSFGFRTFGGSTQMNFQYFDGSNQVKINIGSPAAGLSQNNGYYIIELLY